MSYFAYPSQVFNLSNTNSFDSKYAETYGKDKSRIIGSRIRKVLFDNAPQQYFTDLKLLGLKTPETEMSDEFFYYSYNYQRQAIQTAVLSTAISSGASQVIPIINPDQVAPNTIITYVANNQKANVIAVDRNALTMTVAALTGQSLPALATGNSYYFNNLSSVDADGTNMITQNFRLSPLIEQYNFIQMFAKACPWGRVDKWKTQNNQRVDYMEKNQMEMTRQYQIDISNAFWNGERGQVPTAQGFPAKTMWGLYPQMVDAGSYHLTATSSNLIAAFQDLVFSTEYGPAGNERFLFASPRMLQLLFDLYKFTFIRYQPEGSPSTDLTLKMVQLESSNIVFVPMKRLEDDASFPGWSRRMFLVDMKNIQPKIMWGERHAMVRSRDETDTNLNNYSVEYVEGTYSTQCDNLLGNGWLDVS